MSVHVCVCVCVQHRVTPGICEVLAFFLEQIIYRVVTASTPEVGLSEVIQANI